jgi:hypothetical protein
MKGRATGSAPLSHHCRYVPAHHLRFYFSAHAFFLPYFFPATSFANRLFCRAAAFL